MTEQVVTVLGSIQPSEMGLTDAHNHLWISALEHAADLPVLDQYDPIEQELRAYRQAGGGAQIDCQPGGAGRDGSRLRQLSKASQVHVVACTGFHLRDYYPDQAGLWRLDGQAAADYFLDEIRNGLAETQDARSPVYPGFIKIAVRESLDQSAQHLIEAAVEASLQSGYAIEMHTEKGSEVEVFVEHLMNLGLPLTKLVICHLDKRPDLVLHKELAQAGCLLEYDTFFRPKYAPEENVWRLIPAMVESGWQQSIALATDLADFRLWRSLGEGPGLLGFVETIQGRLQALFSDNEIVDEMMGKNIVNRLALTT